MQLLCSSYASCQNSLLGCPQDGPQRPIHACQLCHLQPATASKLPSSHSLGQQPPPTVLQVSCPVHTLVTSPATRKSASQVAEQVDLRGAGWAGDGEQVQAPLAICCVGRCSAHSHGADISTTTAGQQIRSTKSAESSGQMSYRSVLNTCICRVLLWPAMTRDIRLW